MTSLGRGFLVGHWTASDGSTGCTVVIPPKANVTSCDIRGSSPSSRELEHLHPDRKMTEISGIVLTGGSAFGLATADGVMEWLAAEGIGYKTPGGPIPIVPAAVIFDAAAFSPGNRPDAGSGRKACEGAVESPVETGRVGAGAGATVGKWAGREFLAPGGLGLATAEAEGMEVRALAVVNSVGDILDRDGSVVAGTSAPDPRWRGLSDAGGSPANTVLAILTVHAILDKREVRFLASRGSDGITIAVRPAHTRYDGDVVFAVAAPPLDDGTPADLDVLGHLATEATAEAIRNAVRA
jgi:L-aminopeptidase/D-esterase-like protein